MAFHINYAGIDPLKNPEMDIFGQILKGYQIAKEPGRMKRLEEKENLQNRGLVNKNLIEAAEAEHAPEYYMNRAKSGGLENLYQALKNNYYQQYGGQQAAADLEDTLAGTALKKAQVQNGGIGRTGISSGMRLWTSLPSNVKADMIAQGAAYGYNPEEVATAISFGKTMNDLKEAAKIHGVDVENAEKVFAPTVSNITKQKEMEGRGAELDVLEQRTAKDLSQYGRTFGGYSPAQIMDSLRGKDKDKMIKFLGARAVQPEIAGARSAIANGSNADAALHRAQESALANFEIPGFTITPEIREGVQHYINDLLRDALKARKKTIYNTGNQSAEILRERSTAAQLSDEELRKIAEGL